MTEMPEWLRRLRRVLLVLLAIQVVVLVGTGVWLFFEYRPMATQAWDDIYDLQADVRDAVGVRVVHRVTSTLVVPTALVTGIVLVVTDLRQRVSTAEVLAVVPGTVVVGAAIVATLTGYLLPWDQLALWAVTPGETIEGWRAVLGDEVRFVLIRGIEVSPTTLLRWFVVHVVATVVLVAALASAWRGSRRPRRRVRSVRRTEDAADPARI